MTRRESELQDGWVEVLREPGWDSDIQTLGRAMLRRWLAKRDLTIEQARPDLIRIMEDREIEGVRVLIHVDELDGLGIDVEECLRDNPDPFTQSLRKPMADGR